MEKDGRTIFGGTAFFCTLNSIRHPELAFTYLITAKHCVLTAYQKYGHLKARINLTDDSAAAMIDLPDKWVYSDDPGVDIAVLAINPDPRLKIYSFVAERFLTVKSIEEFGVGIGDETTTVGLFTQRHGKKLNIPILRGGIVAAMPEEPLYDPKTGAEFHAYLVEMRSIGGLSGSPVLVSVPPHRALGYNEERTSDGYSVPLGLIRGHWDIDLSSDACLADFMNDGRMNMGIATVTPIQDVTKVLLENDDFKKLREQAEKDLAEGNLTVQDSSFRFSAPEFTQDGF